MNKTAVLILSCSLCACTLGPDYTRPQSISDQQIDDSLKTSSEQSIPSDPHWYEAFKDPRLNKLVELALADSPTVKIALEKLYQSRLNLKIQGVQYYPTIDLAAGYTKTKPSKNTAIAFKESYYQAGMDVSWELDLWGEGRRLTENARALAQAAAANLENVQVTLKAEVITNYISLRQTQEQLRLLLKTLSLQRDIVALAMDQANCGLISQSDLRQIQYTEDTLKSQIPSLKTALNTYKNNLTLLTGKLPEQLNTLLDDAKNNIITETFRYDLSLLTMIPAKTVRNRPDVRQAEQNLIAQNALIGKATANLFPNISFSALFGFQSDHLPRLPNNSSSMFSLTPSITLPFIHWGALINQVKLEKSATQEAALIYQNAVLNAVNEIKNAMITLSEQINQNQITKDALIKMQDIAALSLTQYDSGLIPLSQTLNILQDLLTAQINLAQGNGLAYQAVVSFYKALGY